jgi:uncharacterized protein YbgA (DUF1722 family)
MSLFGDPAAPPLITTKSGVDHTERTFIFRRWKDLEQADGSIKGLVRFHTDHKLLIMSHDPRSVSALGAIVPLVVPLVLLRHHVRRFAEPCLALRIHP